jgi:endoglucanase
MKWQRVLASFFVAVSFASLSAAQEFRVKRVADDSLALSGTLSGEVKEDELPNPVRFADFSELREPGEYYLEVPGVGKSVSFRVGADVYDGELATAMLGFYGWRASTPVSFDFQGVHFEHAAGHLQDGLLDYVDGQVGKARDGKGGWYDAGDYGRYLPTAAESVATLLSAWELFSDRLEHVELPFIPEHGGELPDFLSEVKWELDWMLKMAYADESGRVHHKLNSSNFPGFVLPADDPTTLYFSGFSTAATAEFVAAMAKAARAFAPYDKVTDGYSQTLLTAALKAYAFLRENPGDVQYDSSVLAAGAYKKNDFSDRVWAAAELWETTGDAEVLADFEGRIGTATAFIPNFDWDQTTNFGLLTYVLSAREGRNPVFVASLTAALDRVAKALITYHGLSSYGRDFPAYYWGSNGVIARTCMLLQSANVLNPTPEYLDVCSAQIAFLYGRNQYNRSQVTGAGVAPPLSPHHRPSGADSVLEPYPGLLVGGGQSATSWQDAQGNFQSNEVAINWNAALVYALSGFIQGQGVESGFGRAPVAAADCGVRLSSIGYVPERAKVATVQSECELPNAFQCAVKDQTLGGDTSGPLQSIDDLEDGDLQIAAKAGRQGGWFAYDDGTGGSRTEPALRSAERAGSKNAICISGQGFTRWGGGIGFRLADAGGAPMLYDAAGYTGLHFWARGSATRFRAMFVDRYSDPAGAVCSGCNDHFQHTFTPSEDWQEYTFSWKQLSQIGFGDAQPNVCPAALYAIQFQWGVGEEFELCLDDVAFTTAAGTAAEPPEGASQVAVTAHGSGCGCQFAAEGARYSGASALLALLLLVRRRAQRSR